jgi:D-alanyl-D-alanine carboxypeptidase (penicillin-binding protein 5/6)
MLASGNDAAYAVAQTVAGSVPAFVRMMNAQARAWHAPGIHFANPDGLPNPHHVVSALGMAIIAEHAMRNPIFRRIVATRRSTLPPDPKPRIYYNQNQLLYDFPGAVGIKIGYTIEADETIVGAAQRHGLLLIAVLLHDTPEGLWPDAENLLDWGFQHFHQAVIIRRGQSLGTVIIGGRKVPVMASRDVTAAVADDRLAHPRWMVQADRPHSRGLIRAHSRVGRVVVVLDREAVAHLEALSQRQIDAPFPTVHDQWIWLLLPVLVLAASILPGRRPPVRARKQGPQHG